MAIDPAELKGRKIGRVLTKLGKVTREQVYEALEVQKTRKVPLGQLMVELGLLKSQDVAEALAGQAGLQYVDLTRFDMPEDLRSVIPTENIKTYDIIPIEFNPVSKRLKIAMKSPDNFRAVDDLRLLMGFNVEAVVADGTIIDAQIKKYFSKSESIKDVVSDLAKDTSKFEGLAGDKSIDLDKIKEASEDNQVIKLLNLVLMQAIKDRASDIHFEPFEHEFKMRYRIDGVLYEMVPPPKQLGPAIISRVKVMAGLDIAERRLPQDGRIELKLGGKPVDLRVAILPTIHGESCVMRVLDRGNVELAIERVGLRPDDLEMFLSLINRPNGIVIVTGPTGSGKTTTLYAALAKLNDIETKVLTAEDPVEYDIDGLCQCGVNEDAGTTFAKLLRSFLRQDPDWPLGDEHAAHQRRAVEHHPTGGSGHGAVPPDRDDRGHRGPAFGEDDLQALQRGIHAQGGGADGAQPHAGGDPGQALHAWAWVRELQQERVPRAYGDLRADGHGRRDA